MVSGSGPTGRHLRDFCSVCCVRSSVEGSQCVQVHRRLGAANTLVRRATRQGDYSNEDNVNAIQPRWVLLRTRVSTVFLRCILQILNN